MPLPLAAIAAGTQIGGSILNPILQAVENKRNREYNKPINQMARLKEAGLNPHLVYGNGANAQMQSQQAPQVDSSAVPQALAQFVNIQKTQVETDKLKAQIELIKEQERLARESVLNRRQSTESMALKYSLDSGLFATNTEMQKEKLRGLTIANEGKLISNAGNLTRNETMKLMQQPNLEKLIQETLMLKARRSLIPYQKDLLVNQAKNLEASTLFTELRGIEQTKKNAVFSDTHQLMILNQKLKEGQIQIQEYQKRLLGIKEQFKGAGLSETATSDLIDLFVPFGAGKKKLTRYEESRWERSPTRNYKYK